MKNIIKAIKRPSFEEALKMKNQILKETKKDGEDKEPFEEACQEFFKICDKYNINDIMILKYLNFFYISFIARNLDFLREYKRKNIVSNDSNNL